MRDGLDKILAEPFPEFSCPFLMTGWAKGWGLPRKAGFSLRFNRYQQLFMAAVFTISSKILKIKS